MGILFIISFTASFLGLIKIQALGLGTTSLHYQVNLTS